MDTSTEQGKSASLRRDGLVLLRREPIDFRRVAAESGLTKGKIVHSPNFGWGVQNTHGIDGPSFGCIAPPPMQAGETWVGLASPHWCFYGPRRADAAKQENAEVTNAGAKTENSQQHE